MMESIDVLRDEGFEMARALERDEGCMARVGLERIAFGLEAPLPGTLTDLRIRNVDLPLSL